MTRNVEPEGREQPTQNSKQYASVDANFARDQLTSVALELFAKRHFDSVSIRDIGKAAGMNPAMIYYYFKNKEDLFCAALRNAVDEAFRFYEEYSGEIQHQSATESIDAWFDVHFRLHKKLRSVVKISMDSSTLQLDQLMLDNSVVDFYHREGRILEDIIKKGIRLGEFKPVDSRITATMISTILDGVLARTFILTDFDIEEAVREFKNLMRIYLTRTEGPSLEEK